MKKHKGREDKLLEDLTHHFTALEVKPNPTPAPPPRPNRQPTTPAPSASASAATTPLPFSRSQSKRLTIGGGGFFGSPMNVGSGLSAAFNNFMGDDPKKKDTKTTKSTKLFGGILGNSNNNTKSKN